MGAFDTDNSCDPENSFQKQQVPLPQSTYRGRGKIMVECTPERDIATLCVLSGAPTKIIHLLSHTELGLAKNRNPIFNLAFELGMALYKNLNLFAQ
jgi:hypothetical protein